MDFNDLVNHPGPFVPQLDPVDTGYFDPRGSELDQEMFEDDDNTLSSTSELDSSTTSDFGSFIYKNLSLLEKQNERTLNTLKKPKKESRRPSRLREMVSVEKDHVLVIDNNKYTLFMIKGLFHRLNIQCTLCLDVLSGMRMIIDGPSFSHCLISNQLNSHTISCSPMQHNCQCHITIQAHEISLAIYTQ